MRSMMTVNETSGLIKSGARLFVFGDESLLAGLPRGELGRDGERATTGSALWRARRSIDEVRDFEYGKGEKQQ